MKSLKYYVAKLGLVLGKKGWHQFFFFALVVNANCFASIGFSKTVGFTWYVVWLIFANFCWFSLKALLEGYGKENERYVRERELTMEQIISSIFNGEPSQDSRVVGAWSTDRRTRTAPVRNSQRDSFVLQLYERELLSPTTVLEYFGFDPTIRESQHLQATGRAVRTLPPESATDREMRELAEAIMADAKKKPHHKEPAKEEPTPKPNIINALTRMEMED